MKVEKKLPDGSYQTLPHTKDLEVTKGIVNGKFII
jgi:hypothetical protein